MSNVLRLAIVDPTDSSREALKTMLLGLDSLWLEAECSRYEFFVDVVSQSDPDVAIINLDADPDQGLKLIEDVLAVAPECNVFAVSSSTEGRIILQAMRAGAKEFLAQPIRLEDLVEALNRIRERRFGKAGQTVQGGTIIAVTGSTGGVGTTTIAVNLACALAQKETQSVCLVDLDLCLGDADVLLDTIPEYTIADVAQNIDRLDFSLLKRSLTKHTSGVYLLPRPVHLQECGLIVPEDLKRMLGLLKATFTHLVLDLSKGFTANDLTAMIAATHVVLVTQIDLPCLRNVVRLLMSFNEVEGLSEKVKIVINRMGMGDNQISIKKAQETIGREIFCEVPNDYRTVIEARNNGIPLVEQAPKAAVTQAIVSLAEALSGDDPEAKPILSSGGSKSSLGRFLGFLSGKK